MDDNTEPPCTTCLVRSVCGRTIVQKGQTIYNHLIMEFAEQCPFLSKYFNENENSLRSNYKKISKVSKIHGGKGRFVWFSNEIGIYKSSKNIFGSKK